MCLLGCVCLSFCYVFCKARRQNSAVNSKRSLTLLMYRSNIILSLLNKIILLMKPSIVLGRLLSLSLLSGPGYYRSETDCSTYYICDQSLTAHKFVCPAGLVFDLIRRLCNWPRHVICGEGSSPLSKCGGLRLLSCICVTILKSVM